jgi:hypothetical protein
MRQILTIFALISSFSLFFSGCEVVDKINKEILDIDDDEETTAIVIEETTPDETTDEIDETDSVVDGNEDTGTIPNDDVPSLDDEVVSDEEDNSVVDSNVDNTTDIEDTEEVIDDSILVTDFTLTLPDYNNASSYDFKMGTNQNLEIRIRSTPTQQDEVITLKKLEGEGAITDDRITLTLDGQARVDKEYDYTIQVASSNILGIDKFRVELDNGTYKKKIDFTITVEKQLSITAIKNEGATYPIVADGDEVNITLYASNTLGNDLKFDIKDEALINEREIISLFIEKKLFQENTENGIEFTMQVIGLKEGTENIEIEMTELKNGKPTGASEDYFFNIESTKRNTEMTYDLFECGVSSTTGYERTVDDNSPASPDASQSADGLIYLLSRHETNIGNNFSKVLVYHQTMTATSSGDFEYGIHYIFDPKNGAEIANIYYDSTLAGTKFFVKYYSESDKDIVCRESAFPSFDPQTYDSTDINNYSQTTDSIDFCFTPEGC